MNLLAKFFGRSTEIEMHEPTNEEYNNYSDEIGEAVKKESDELLSAVRVKYFDLWAIKKNGKAEWDKSAIPVKIKNSIMFKTFEVVDVTEKN